MRKLILLLSTLIFFASTPSRTDLIKDIERSIVLVQHPTENDQTYTCTGFVINAAKGWVVTALHCVMENGQMVKALYVDGQPSEILKRDKGLVIVSITPMAKPPLDVRKDYPAIGEPVVEFGYGYGVMTVLQRNVAARVDDDVVLDAPASPGMSGGPVVDANGKVIAVLQATTASTSIGCGPKEIRDVLNSK